MINTEKQQQQKRKDVKQTEKAEKEQKNGATGRKRHKNSPNRKRVVTEKQGQKRRQRGYEWSAIGSEGRLNPAYGGAGLPGRQGKGGNRRGVRTGLLAGWREGAKTASSIFITVR